MNVKATILFLILILTSCASEPTSVSNVSNHQNADIRAQRLLRQKDALVSFYQPMRVMDGDWLETQHEAGETFDEYIASNPTLPTPERRTIYIQPIGTFDRGQIRVVQLAAEYIAAFYNLPVKINAAMRLGPVPKGKQRRIEWKNNLQIRTSYFLEDVLPDLLPNDAAALIAFTNYDLYPGDTWAFVFGQATFSERVGVYSLYRLRGSDGRAGSDLFLDRTLKLAVHEVGHMFSMKHCVKFECLMSGTNHLDETDRRPLDNCPECTAKAAWAMRYDLVERYRALAAFWQKMGRPLEARSMREKSAAVDKIK